MKKLSLFLFFLLAPVVAYSDQCRLIEDFITLGESANKCIAELRKDSKRATITLTNSGYCTDVRKIRGNVETKLINLPPSVVNKCASRNLQAYTKAATSLQRMYQLELSLR